MQNVNSLLQKINNASLAKIIFYDSSMSFDQFKNNLEFYNIVFTGDGIFIALKNKFGISIRKIQNVEYSNSKLIRFDCNTVILPLVPKPPISEFAKILEIFKYINNKNRSELCINVYFNIKTSNFYLDILNQYTNPIKIEYEYNSELENSDNYIRYLQIHSHNTMPAKFSSTDNIDEKFSQLCYYGVVGKINSNSEFYNVDTSFRFWTGIDFVSVDLSTVFNTGIAQIKLHPTIIEKLDQIIESSKIKDMETKTDLISYETLLNGLD